MPNGASEQQPVENPSDGQTETDLSETGGEGIDPAAETADETADEMVSLGAADYQRLQEELGELRGRILRMQADFDNTRKRLRLQAEQAGQRVLSRFVGSLLIEMDTFSHALKAAHPDKFQDFAMGVTMIHQNLLTVLGGSGIEPIPCEGVFDPARHEVVQEVERPELPRGSIVEVLRQGYTLGDQVVRAAQVIVSRPPREAAGETDAPPADAE